MRGNAYWVLNAGLTWEAPSGLYNVRLWGKNLIDENYAVFGLQRGRALRTPPRRPARTV
jgi:outer membrane receptor for monomeric catechols